MLEGVTEHTLILELQHDALMRSRYSRHLDHRKARILCASSSAFREAQNIYQLSIECNKLTDAVVEMRKRMDKEIKPYRWETWEIEPKRVIFTQEDYEEIERLERGSGPRKNV